ncbi:uncharacterized protein L201_004150 [Kwoniella dendrophila CBS 6074]|uniref:Uncharacterized protein n=1 Tax=Kwoniella dendrophila CBS 6074 TaxID=1295534 RepID=A0AAX4JX83_9TREE
MSNGNHDLNGHVVVNTTTTTTNSAFTNFDQNNSNNNNNNNYNHDQITIQPDFFRGLDIDTSTTSLDPSLFALAAQVQAVAHAHEQGIDINFNIDPTFIDPIFPEGLEGLGGLGGENQLIDPSLFEIAQVVDDVNKGKIKLELDQPNSVPSALNIPNNLHQQQQQHQQQIHPLVLDNSNNSNVNNGQSQYPQQSNVDVIQLDDEIDPTLREIVNSLTNAQQSSQVNGQGLSHAQAAAAIGAHLTDVEERERLQQSLQTTLEDLTKADFGSIFPPNFAQSPPNNFLNLAPDASLISDSSNAHEIPQAGPSTNHQINNSTTHSTPHSITKSIHIQPHSHEEYGSKRGRGRPKGSKNKHKAIPIPKPPKPVGPPPKPKGRPPKERNPEEQADYELRKQERELGIKRRKGRPRKFPGYLVREMRLKKNRKEFNELLRNHNSNNSNSSDEDDDDDDENENDNNDLNAGINIELEDNNQNHSENENIINTNNNHHHQYDPNDLQGIEKVQEEMRMMMDVENMTNGLHQALQVNVNHNNNNIPNHDHNTDNHHTHMNGNGHHQHQHQHHNEDNENDFGNWSVVQDGHGQTLLDVVGMNTTNHGVVGGVNDHTMEGVFGLNH